MINKTYHGNKVDGLLILESNDIWNNHRVICGHHLSCELMFKRCIPFSSYASKKHGTFKKQLCLVLYIPLDYLGLWGGNAFFVAVLLFHKFWK